MHLLIHAFRANMHRQTQEGFKLAATSRFKAATCARVILGILVAVWFLSVSAQAALLTFTIGSGEVAPEGEVTLPITVTGSAGQNWISAEFVLVWNTSVLTITDFTINDLFVDDATFAPETGSFSFFSGGSVNVPDPTELVSLTFEAAIDASLSPPPYEISFSMSQPPEVGLANLTTDDPTPVSGFVTVVPEPVGIALSLFACAFVTLPKLRRFVRANQVKPLMR